MRIKRNKAESEEGGRKRGKKMRWSMMKRLPDAARKNVRLEI